MDLIFQMHNEIKERSEDIEKTVDITLHTFFGEIVKK